MADAGEIKAKITITYDGSGVEKAKEDLAKLAESAGSVGEGANTGSEGLAGLDEQAQKTAESTQNLNSSIGAMEKPLETANKSIAGMTEAVQEHQAALEETGKAYADLQKPMGETVSLFQDAAPPMQSMQKSLNAVSDSYVNMASSLQDAAPTFREAFNIPSDVVLQFDKDGRLIGDSVKYFDAATPQVENFGKAMQASAPQMQAFTSQVGDLNTAVKNSSSIINEFGGIGEALYGPEESLGGSLGRILKGAASDLGAGFGSVSGLLNDVAMPMMAVQMIGMAVVAGSQALYNMAAVAEGPAAHSMGTFTGSVDALGQSFQHVGGIFAESFGKQMIPTLDAMNNQLGQTSGTFQSMGGFLGGAVADITNWGEVIGGLASITNPATADLGLQMVIAGGKGLINQGAAMFGLPEVFQGTTPMTQYQQQMLQLPQIVQQNAQQLQLQASVTLADAVNPDWLAANNQNMVAQQAAQRLIASYNAGHPISQFQAIQKAKEQLYDIQQGRNYQYQMDNQPGWLQQIGDYWGAFFATADNAPPPLENPNQGASDSSNYYGQGAIGCFPAGSRVLMADRTEKPIENIQIGDCILAHDGENQVTTTVLTLIRPRPKLVYELLFSDGTFLQTTDSHPISTVTGWKSLSPEATKLENPDLAVSTLQIGDIVHTLAGSTMLLSVKPLEKMKIYNLTVDDPHTFYVEKILVHNKSNRSYGPPPGSGGGGIDWGGIGNNISGFFGGIGNGIGNFFGGIGDWFNGLFGSNGASADFNAAAGCFPADTPVLLANGTTKPIEMLEVGEYVLAYDGKKRVATPVLARIVPPPKPVYELQLSDGTLLKLTDSHPISTVDGWKSISPQATALENPDLEVKALELGDTIHTVNGTCVLVDMYRLPGVVQVYNITVAEPHTFYAGGVLVHNKALAGVMQQNLAESQVPAMDFKNTPLMSSIVGNFSSMDLNHTFTATATWVGNNLQNTFQGAASWVAQGLSNTFQGVAAWVGQGLSNTFNGIASWIGSGLSNTFQGVASWFGQGLSNTFQGVASWFGTGLQNTFQGIASWAGSNLSNTFQGVASWFGTNLSKTFQGVADWVGKDLDHTFVASPTWIGQNLNPTFYASPSWLPGFAAGVKNFSGGYAVVGERGPELVYLPQGSNVIPNHELDGITGGGSGIGGGFVINITHVTQLDGRTIMRESTQHLATAARQLTGGKR